MAADTTHLKQLTSQGRQIAILELLSAKYPEGHIDLHIPSNINPDMQLVQYVALVHVEQGFTHLVQIDHPNEVSMKYPDPQLLWLMHVDCYEKNMGKRSEELQVRHAVAFEHVRH